MNDALCVMRNWKKRTMADSYYICKHCYEWLDVAPSHWRETPDDFSCPSCMTSYTWTVNEYGWVIVPAQDVLKIKTYEKWVGDPPVLTPKQKADLDAVFEKMKDAQSGDMIMLPVMGDLPDDAFDDPGDGCGGT